ncbi:MAG: endolytic transglycosylase MltG [Micrococcales bacterium]|nr:endolytic transglycosylase MltG [Micrococcales bacterium]
MNDEQIVARLRDGLDTPEPQVVVDPASVLRQGRRVRGVRTAAMTAAVVLVFGVVISVFALARPDSSPADNPTVSPSAIPAQVVVPEGSALAQTTQVISARTGISMADLDAAIADPASLGIPEQFCSLQDVTAPERVVEGWLAPGTYDVPAGATAVDVLSEMVGRTTVMLTDRQVPQDQWHRVLIIASIIDHEVGRDEDRPKVARVFENRLATGIPLQADSTVAYSLGISALKLTAAHLNDPTNPYNTYAVRGLPPGAIASPRLASVEAVLNPAEGDWVYWCVVNLKTQETKFTADYNELMTFKRELADWLADTDEGP